jgi:hypothetical protein
MLVKFQKKKKKKKKTQNARENNVVGSSRLEGKPKPKQSHDPT